ncbi:deoxycytidyl transferase [Knufia obscura]|uniref:DNA repair protein REV1 n=1 Tax=Knufia obscura TaxID=1635080 RepID=A0ABR0RZG6_9EURO|nr:deoxycytidyl transferase [Knufia obscura]
MGSRLEKNSSDVRKRIAGHTFDGEDGEEYAASKFGGFTDYMRRKKIKLQNLDAELRSQSDKPQVFRNVVAYVNGYTQPSLADLHVLIVSHGGGFLQYLDGKTAVTHVIASQLTPKKKVEFARYRIVKPAWVVDSVQAGRLLPWENYRVVDEGVKQKVLGFDSGHMVSQASNQKQGYRDQSDTSWYTSQVKDVADRVNGVPSSERADDFEAQFDEQEVDDNGPGTSQLLADDDLLQAEATLQPQPVEETSTIEGNQTIGSAEEIGAVHAAETEHDVSTSDMVQNPQTAGSPPVGGGATTPEKRALTAEEHNAILLQNPHMAKSSTANPDFLNQYYRESRLHHLSTWKAELKTQLQARAQESSSQKQKLKRPPGTRRYIMHVDFDSFFAAVSLRENPQLKEKPVVVAHGSGPGSEIASCNYPARNFGVKNGMWMKHALEVCPDLKVLPYDYKAYEDASKHFYDAILAIDGIVQSISIDEALIDVSEQCIRAGGSDGRGMSEGSVYREQAKANELAQALRNLVREKTGCEVSVGIGGNILLAKVALRKAKPAGQHLITPEAVLDFIADLTVTQLPGVAYSIGNKLEEIGVKFVKDIRGLTKEKLVNTLGPKTGEKLCDYSRGVDKQQVGEQVIRKSVSAEVNWGIRFVNQQQAEEFVMSLCEELSKRLLEQLVKGRQLTMKIMRKAADAGLDPPKNLGHGKCDTFNKSVVLGVATNDKLILGKEAVAILRGYGFPPGELRGLGVQMQKLEPLKPSMASSATPLESSQRRLQFKKPEMQTKTPSRPSPAPSSIYAKPNSLPLSNQGSAQTPTPKVKKPEDLIEEVPTPEKSRTLSARHDLSQLEDSSNTPLNIGGTQFVIPSQIDPSVLAELPADIRSKLAPRTSKLFERYVKQDSASDEARSRSQSPFVSDSELALPNESQLDPETLAALPDDVREELLAEYRNASRTSASSKTQQLLPQSPRKARPLPTKKLSTTPKKKHKFTSLMTKGRSKTNSAFLPTLTQSNFVSMKNGSTSAAVDALIANDDISAEFLQELPEEIRAEILAEQKRQRMKQKSGLNLAESRKRNRPGKKDEVIRGQQKLSIPRPDPKPTFTSRKLSTVPELREAMSQWVQAFSGDGEEGPYQEDTEALGVYLNRVVLEEGDMAKAQAVVDWLVYVVGDWPFENGQTSAAWQDTIGALKSAVQLAVGERGLAPLQFSE